MSEDTSRIALATSQLTGASRNHITAVMGGMWGQSDHDPVGPLEVSPADEAIVASISRLRVRAWKARRRGFPDVDEWIDDFDQVGRHWVYFFRDQPVAAARMTTHAILRDVPNAEIYAAALPLAKSGRIASFNRLVVDPAFAGRGLSRQLDVERIDAARAENCSMVVAQTSNPVRISGLEALGFVSAGRSLPYLSGPLATSNREGVVLVKLLQGE